MFQPACVPMIQYEEQGQSNWYQTGVLWPPACLMFKRNQLIQSEPKHILHVNILHISTVPQFFKKNKKIKAVLKSSDCVVKLLTSDSEQNLFNQFLSYMTCEHNYSLPSGGEGGGTEGERGGIAQLVGFAVLCDAALCVQSSDEDLFSGRGDFFPWS